MKKKIIDYKNLSKSVSIDSNKIDAFCYQAFDFPWLVYSFLKKIKPERAILTHLNHEVDYDELSKSLPPGVEVGFDGMKITF